MPFRNLSSPLTPIVRFVLPVAFPGFVGWIGITAITDNGATLGDLTPLGSIAAFLALLLAISSILFYAGSRFKRVRLDGHMLRISNYIDEIEVPLSAVERVTEFSWSNSHPITLQFAERTTFGSKVTFMPSHKATIVGGEHPLRQELEQLISFAKRAGRGA